MELRSLTNPSAKNKDKNLRKKETDFQQRLNDLDSSISSSVDSGQVNRMEAE